MSIDEKVTALADARKAEAVAKALAYATNEAIEQFLMTLGLAATRDERASQLKAAKAATAAAYTAVKVEARDIYTKTKNTHPHPAITVKLFSTYSYDLGKALKYSLEYLKKAVTLNQKTFEKAAKSAGLDFVEIGVDPRPEAKKNLSKWESEPALRCSPFPGEEGF